MPRWTFLGNKKLFTFAALPEVLWAGQETNIHETASPVVEGKAHTFPPKTLGNVRTETDKMRPFHQK